MRCLSSLRQAWDLQRGSAHSVCAPRFHYLPPMSLALARKYRPRTFADVAVQSHVASTLKGAIARGRVAHGYLLCGPRGVGKTTLPRVPAMALNCERRLEAAKQLAPGETLPPEAGEPCGECQSCRRIWS